MLAKAKLRLNGLIRKSRIYFARNSELFCQFFFTVHKTAIIYWPVILSIRIGIIAKCIWSLMVIALIAQYTNNFFQQVIPPLFDQEGLIIRET